MSFTTREYRKGAREIEAARKRCAEVHGGNRDLANDSGPMCFGGAYYEGTEVALPRCPRPEDHLVTREQANLMTS